MFTVEAKALKIKNTETVIEIHQNSVGKTVVLQVIVHTFGSGILFSSFSFGVKLRKKDFKQTFNFMQ